MSLSAMTSKTMLLVAIAVGYAGIGFSPLSAAKKMRPEELVSLHLDAIGPADARTGMKSRIFRGEGVWRVLQGGRAQLPGTVYEASDGNSISVRFDTRGNPTYFGEHLVYNGKDIRIFQGFQAGRSPLGEFCMNNKALLREGLLGGVTSTAWPLLHLEARGAKLKYAGLKKVDDRQLHRLDYKPRKSGGPAKIQLFFEPDTYRHVQTRYRYEVPRRHRRQSRCISRRTEHLRDGHRDLLELPGYRRPHVARALEDPLQPHGSRRRSGLDGRRVGVRFQQRGSQRTHRPVAI